MNEEQKTFIGMARLFITLSTIVFILAIAGLFTSCGNSKTLNVDVPKSLEKPCIIYYTSDHCGWCKKFKPNWESVKSDSQYSDIKFYENIHSSLFDISGIPALIFIDKNGKVSKVVGYHSENKFRENIKNLIR